MEPRSRILAFGGAGVMVMAGVVCAFAIAGLTGQVLAIALITLGLGGVVLLVFFEVGLSEDHARAREEERRRRRARAKAPTHRAVAPRRQLPRRPRRPG